ncbi:peptidoglycan-binding protein [Halalkalibacterium halodurans]|uniref:peptidoglycan-binding protein n=1 Tax=Halalkalibacterium halodurans TaxID=86665 RepID=UPI0006A9EE0F|nr:peptidoglycan-binding protein [Halalkalibacterium halodurans]TPE70686.1 LysM peptidoglycan-binding domain-containing protein [Halalkalibacterium halodurans]
MGYRFEKLSQLSDQRNRLRKKGNYSKRTQPITVRAWHHSLTKKHSAGSTAAGFANYHVGSLGWPGIGYTFVIEPQNIVNTPNGKRARIVYCHDIDRRTYHVGNSNSFALGICVAGDYRTEQLDQPTLASIADLHSALVADKIGSSDKSHHEFPGYAWKQCCTFDYKKAFKAQSPSDQTNTKPPATVPSTYTIQEGDTFWSIAHKNSATGVTVEGLIKANPGVDPTKLKVGQVINFNTKASKSNNEHKQSQSGASKAKPSGDPYVRNIQQFVNSYGFSIAVDGIAGPQTMRGLVKVLQTELNKQFGRGLKVDGIFGPRTRAALVNVRAGARGNLTRVLQALLYIKGYNPGPFDGIFGGKTESAVRAFQRAKGLTVDGIVGPQTWGALLR